MDVDPTRSDTEAGQEAGAEPGSLPLRVTVECATREAVEKALVQTNGNVAEAAAALGIIRTSLYRIMKRYGMATQTPSKR